MKRDTTAQELWDHLERLFQDHKLTRAVYLEEQFSNTRLVQFANMTEFCNKIKSLANQLANVDNPVSDKKMVLQLIRGLGKGDYDAVGTLIQQTKPLPTFDEARSQLILEETRRSKQEDDAREVATLVAPSSPPRSEQPH
ncbi:Retrovirus-related Pol polyprotein from transposon TNT 1-94 [Bienertia sinuspersici]